LSFFFRDFASRAVGLPGETACRMKRPQSPRPARGAPTALLLAALALAGCGGEGKERARWVALAPLFRPEAVRSVDDPAAGAPFLRRDPVDGAPLLRRDPADESGAWLDFPLPRERWRAEGEGEWSSARPPVPAVARGEVRLVSGERRFHARDPKGFKKAAGDQDVFELGDARLRLRTAGAGELPLGLVLSTWIERRERAAPGRALAGELAADGIALWPGERTELASALPRDAVLRVTTVAQGLGAPGTVEFRVECDGRELLAHTVTLGDEPVVEQHVLPLPDEAEARFVFEVRGAPGVTLFAEPVLGPRELGRYGARPWPDARPDVVLFVADTFRADNLACYGGTEAKTPNLGRLAERSVRFLDARSHSTWTLPSHGTLFTGMTPVRHGGMEQAGTFDPALLTLAELFAAQGYRTGAVTDAAFVARAFGMDQGFGWWQESGRGERSLATTLARADDFLERDDGRPVFLFVHTYRVHEPYRVGPDEDAEPLHALWRRARATVAENDGRLPLELVAEYRALYRAGVEALDAALGPWLAGLEGRGLLEHGYIVFTSDHGEAFHEHGDLSHGGMPFEEQVRIPLLIAGGGLAPRDERCGAGLIDLAPTLGELCGLPAEAQWSGSSLLRARTSPPLLAFGRGHMALVEGGEKALLELETDAGSREIHGVRKLRAAFDLTVDPGERADVAEGAAWAAELTEEARARLAEELAHRRGASAVELPAGALQDLRSLGYTGEDE